MGLSGHEVGIVGLSGDELYPVGAISNCYSTGDVSGGDFVGGLVGYIAFDSVSKSYSTGAVAGNSGVGGLVGYNYYGILSNCYSIGSVCGDYMVGGLVGRNGLRSLILRPGDIFNSYSSGNVRGTSNVGGLVGFNECGDVERSFWDVQTSGEPNMCGYQNSEATGCDPNCGKTTAEMHTKSTFTEVGWDFIEVWDIGENQTYPFIRAYLAGDINHDGVVDFRDIAYLAESWLSGL